MHRRRTWVVPSGVPRGFVHGATPTALVRSWPTALVKPPLVPTTAQMDVRGAEQGQRVNAGAYGFQSGAQHE